MAKAYISVDVGASSGRLIIGWIEEGKICIEEIHRFKNSMVFQQNHYNWNLNHLLTEIIEGLKKASSSKWEFASIGIDTWAVDYVLLDKNDELVAPCFAYRDHRTDNTLQKIADLMSLKKIYKSTGIQFLQINTLFQLYEHVREYPKDLELTETFLMVPDYLNYLLTGKKCVEYTNATTTQLLNLKTKDWDQQLLRAIGVKSHIMPKPIHPGSVIGDLTEHVSNQTGLKGIKVIAPATHDTGSAIVAIPTSDPYFAYISSGTWSLMGVESNKHITNSKASRYNFTNEGGVGDTYRVLKNIMGLWLIQEVLRIYKGKYSFAEFVQMAEHSEPFYCIINPNESRFLNSHDMVQEIQDYCKETHQKIPTTPGEIARCIFESLAFCYRQTLMELREISDTPIRRIHIIGGGGQNKFLNQLCASFTGCEVHSGPVEATAIGNLVMQIVTMGEVKDIATARQMIASSFPIEIYKPIEDEKIDANYKKYRRLGRYTKQ